MGRPRKKAEGENPSADFDPSVFVKQVQIPDGCEGVFVTTDGQVFFPDNYQHAVKHAEKNKLKVVPYKL